MAPGEMGGLEEKVELGAIFQNRSSSATEGVCEQLPWEIRKPSRDDPQRKRALTTPKGSRCRSFQHIVAPSPAATDCFTGLTSMT